MEVKVRAELREGRRFVYGPLEWPDGMPLPRVNESLAVSSEDGLAVMSRRVSDVVLVQPSDEVLLIWHLAAMDEIQTQEEQASLLRDFGFREIAPRTEDVSTGRDVFARFMELGSVHDIAREVRVWGTAVAHAAQSAMYVHATQSVEHAVYRMDESTQAVERAVKGLDRSTNAVEVAVERMNRATSVLQVVAIILAFIALVVSVVTAAFA